jgi:hypothetical protein
MRRTDDTRPTSIYVLKDPRNNEIRYVGKTVKKLSDRLCSHICVAKKREVINHRTNWIYSLLSQGLEPIMELIETVPVNEGWQERERYWIKHYRELGYNLVNVTDGGGGDGPIVCKWNVNRHSGMRGKKMSDEHRAKISKSLKGKVRTKAHCQRISETKFGGLNPLAKTVFQYGMDGIFIREWACTMDVQRELSIEHSSISKSCSGKASSAGGFQWRYFCHTDGIEPVVRYKTQMIPIVQHTIEGEFIREWESATTAGRELGINNSRISECCRGKLKTAGGFIWRYKVK